MTAPQSHRSARRPQRAIQSAFPAIPDEGSLIAMTPEEQDRPGHRAVFGPSARYAVCRGGTITIKSGDYSPSTPIA
jgi:hypothetical protein